MRFKFGYMFPQSVELKLRKLKLNTLPLLTHNKYESPWPLHVQNEVRPRRSLCQRLRRSVISDGSVGWCISSKYHRMQQALYPKCANCQTWRKRAQSGFICAFKSKVNLLQQLEVPQLPKLCSSCHVTCGLAELLKRSYLGKDNVGSP